jgi:UDP-N-acetylglucosamine acyltransferase
MSLIDSRAVIDPAAKIADGVSVGPFSVIGPDVEIGEGSWIGPHVVINGPTRIGKNNKIYQFASIGEAPQDIGYRDEPTQLEIGDDNVIRESCTLSRGTVKGGGLTSVGNNNFLMAYSHVAHDCHVGNHTVFANGASLGGHVEIGDYVILGGFALIHQFVKVGAYSFCGMGCGVSKDVPPYIIISGNPAEAHGLNSIGLKRRGLSDSAIKGLRDAYRIIYKSGLKLTDAVTEVKSRLPDCAEAQNFADFIANAERSIVR